MKRLRSSTSLLALFCALTLLSAHSAQAASRWGADYFPNVELVTHEGETVRFFDDLIKDRIVVINFIYTHCPDVCPLETAQLIRVQDILGDRLGSDIFFYSITIDPDNDTVDALHQYRNQFGARWTFLTGDERDIILLRRKLGLYIEDKEGGSTNHNVSMIIGNQTSGRWMRRSPFENPHVLADQLINWLSEWKTVQADRDYADAPALRPVSNGEQLYRTRCVSCHSIDGSGDGLIGPDLQGVTQRRNRQWLVDWLRAPDEMLLNKDPIAIALYRQFNNVAMPNLGLSQSDIEELLRYMDTHAGPQPGPQRDQHTGHLAQNKQDGHDHMMHAAQTQKVNSNSHSAEKFLPVALADTVAIMNGRVQVTPHNENLAAGYLTLVNPNAEPVTLVSIDSDDFAGVKMHEMSMLDGLTKMSELTELVIPAAGMVQFEPGGKHLMLEDPVQPIVAGQAVSFQLKFATGKTQTVSIAVGSP